MNTDNQVSRLGLLSDAAACAKKMRSLSIRTADGNRVSLLNDDQCSSARSVSSTSTVFSTALSQQSVPNMTADSLPFFTNCLHSPITCKSSLQSSPTRLPSLATLIQAVNMTEHGQDYGHRHHKNTYNHAHQQPMLPLPAFPNPYSPNHLHTHYHKKNIVQPVPLVPGMSIPACTQIVPRTSPTKRKYICTHVGCGKAFTTSGHLSRHYRIHTGEKNYHCLYPGCTSRFSRQDNMMQHYRTHLSPRSRRTRSIRGSRSSSTSASVVSDSTASVGDSAGMQSRSNCHTGAPQSAFHPYKRDYVQHSPQESMQWPFF
ncbi:transcriptional repressor [Coemansia sp. RSA 2703]|nr:transcriptional repressor [Coemansia sp. RSA 2703]